MEEKKEADNDDDHDSNDGNTEVQLCACKFLCVFLPMKERV